MTNTPLRILLADDHPILREGLALILDNQTDMTVVGEASNGREAVEVFRQLQPDVTLMDLRMPEMGGVEAIVAIRTEFSTACIILLTTYDGDEDIYRGLRAGAKSYLLKDASTQEILSAIRQVCTGKNHISPAVGARLAERAQMPELTDREREVLQQMAKGQSNLEIGLTLRIAESTVKTHVNSILSKLGVGDRTQAAIVALKRGIAKL
ncbi:response regulator transcription factor [Microcoleus sp. bin38.metabat.b11b12b14.051]|uniref:response regulator n=1 Tax=Microcoleus sp. bin38.metabat.b11b12b14.051 TaxID=2742709 RepID=UPI0025D5ED2F|nr:response regulator transcription factor [Microcoleus sp. bin38.metabat.b11b12b14.051]